MTFKLEVPTSLDSSAFRLVPHLRIFNIEELMGKSQTCEICTLGENYSDFVKIKTNS